MSEQLSIYRVYTSCMKPIEDIPYADLAKEIHFVLAFARDYSDTTNTKGEFQPYYDASVTASAIKAIRNKASNPQVKFFLSIGGRSNKFQFDVEPTSKNDWVKKARTSLTKILNGLEVRGIDIYYENIKSSSEGVFADAIFDLVYNLKKDKVIDYISITVSARVNHRYQELFRKNKNLFDCVVYQTHNETYQITDFDALESILHKLSYDQNKIMPGHSDVRADWAKVSPPVFLGLIPRLIDQNFYGISQWTVVTDQPDHDPEA